MKGSFFLLLVIVNSITADIFAQQKPRYWDDVEIIKKYDQLYSPPRNPILFTGSSSIRKWNDLERTFSNYTVLNRAIGGAVINDISFYLKPLVLIYKPRQVVLYVGENDLPDTASTPDSIFNRTKALLRTIRDSLPGVPIVYISIKPSPVREKYINKAIASNELIRNFISTQTNMSFVDVFKRMLTKEGKPRPDLFVEDMLHMNEQGYSIWRKTIKPYLLKQ